MEGRKEGIKRENIAEIAHSALKAVCGPSEHPWALLLAPH